MTETDSSSMTPAVMRLRGALKRLQALGSVKESLAELDARQLAEIAHDWFGLWAREDQKPPVDGNWRNWLILGGRGAGKTRAGAEWVKARATGQGITTGPLARRIALVAPTIGEARMVMIEGVSGLLAVHDESWRPVFEPTKRQLTWPNGCVAQVFSAEEPDGLRGPQFDGAWCDELAKWKHGEQVWDMLQFALRLGENPQAVITTTPRPIPLLKRLLADDGTVTSRAAPRHSTTAPIWRSLFWMRC